MDNRKIIVTSYLLSSMVLWFLTRSAIQWFYLTFYQVRRLPGIAFAREALPVLVGGVAFLILFRHPRTTPLLDEVITELKKVTWPSRDEVVKSTTVVLICVLFASFMLAGFDLAWGKVIGFLLHS
jgi:preprotein translocase SecE subunit